jgi:hypothetical protein
MPQYETVSADWHIIEPPALGHPRREVAAR